MGGVQSAGHRSVDADPVASPSGWRRDLNSYNPNREKGREKYNNATKLAKLAILELSIGNFMHTYEQADRYDHFPY